MDKGAKNQARMRRSLWFGAAMLATIAIAAGQAGTSNAKATAGQGAYSFVAQPTGVITSTATVIRTVGASTTAVPTLVVPTSVYQAGGVGPFLYADPAFERVWDRTDHPVKLGQVNRTWFWGPGPNTGGLTEQYNDSPLGNKSRLVQYFDKSRMELNNPNADPTKPFFVTNGLLTVELISGFIQVGERDFTQYHPACTPMSGDPGDNLAPTYFAFQKVSNTQAGDHPSTNRTGQKVTETIDRNGVTGTDPSKGNAAGLELAYFEPTTKHNIPQVFWNFLNSSGVTHNDQHQQVTQQLISPWFFASGLPISEPYWARATIRGSAVDVLIQAFERRVLTFVPANGPGFQVEMGNIGQHYFDWRYRNAGFCPGVVGGAPTPPVPVATGTSIPGGTRTATPAVTTVPRPTFTPCPTCPTSTPTATVDIPPGPIVTAAPLTPSPTPTHAITATATRTAVPSPTR